jgi:hypothetical protein
LTLQNHYNLSTVLLRHLGGGGGREHLQITLEKACLSQSSEKSTSRLVDISRHIICFCFVRSLRRHGQREVATHIDENTRPIKNGPKTLSMGFREGIITRATVEHSDLATSVDTSKRAGWACFMIERHQMTVSIVCARKNCCPSQKLAWPHIHWQHVNRIW